MTVDVSWLPTDYWQEKKRFSAKNHCSHKSEKEKLRRVKTNCSHQACFNYIPDKRQKKTYGLDRKFQDTLYFCHIVEQLKLKSKSY